VPQWSETMYKNHLLFSPVESKNEQKKISSSVNKCQRDVGCCILSLHKPSLEGRSWYVWVSVKFPSLSLDSISIFTTSLIDGLFVGDTLVHPKASFNTVSMWFTVVWSSRSTRVSSISGVKELLWSLIWFLTHDTRSPPWSSGWTGVLPVSNSNSTTP